MGRDIRPKKNGTCFCGQTTKIYEASFAHVLGDGSIVTWPAAGLNWSNHEGWYNGGGTDCGNSTASSEKDETCTTSHKMEGCSDKEWKSWMHCYRCNKVSHISQNWSQCLSLHNALSISKQKTLTFVERVRSKEKMVKQEVYIYILDMETVKCCGIRFTQLGVNNRDYIHVVVLVVNSGGVDWLSRMWVTELA